MLPAHPVRMEKQDSPGLLYRLFISVSLLLCCSVALPNVFPGLVFGHGLGAGFHRTKLGQYAYAFAWIEAFARLHPEVVISCIALGVGIPALVIRKWLAFRNARFTARMTGIDDELKGLRFPLRQFNVWPYLKKGRQGRTFVGRTPERRFFPPWGLRWRPVYLSLEERSMHRHVLGKTGSGKTTSILWPQVFQDAMDGKGVLVMDAKGSDENAQMMRSIAAAAGRESQLRIFALPAWNRPQLFSHTYNLVHVARFSQEGPGGDVAAMAERVFAAFEMGDNTYYNTQAFLAFSRICRLLHGMKVPFNLQDVGICISGLGAPQIAAGKAVKFCLETSWDREVAEELRCQVQSLGKDLPSCLSGLSGAVGKFQSPIVNAYEPDLIFEEALEKNLLVYVQLPSNLFKLQAPALGKMMLMDLQQEASLRQVFRQARNQTPFSVNIDEFGTFADLSIIDSLNRLRDANIQFTLSHQSLADLEIVSKEFAQSVWDSTRTKDLLAQDSPELCERMARSLGTTPRLENTVQQVAGRLAIIAATGVFSSRAVEAYRLHPNRLKSLASTGQGYLFASRPSGRIAIPIVYGHMPELPAPSISPLPRKDQGRAQGLRLYQRFLAPAKMTHGQTTPVLN